MTNQLTTFYVGGDLYGIEVMRIQEVTDKLQVIPIPLAPDFVRGLNNLRGQIATAIGLQELFGISTKPPAEASVVCKLDGSLISLIVDSIGDVIDVNEASFEPCPETIPPKVKKFLKGIYKIDGALLSVFDLERLTKEIMMLSQPLDSKVI